MANTIQFITPDNKLVTRSADPASIKDAEDIGYKVATPENLEEMRKQLQYGEGVGNEAKAFLQGAGEGATFGASTPLAISTGLLSPEAAAERTARNPIAHGAGEIAGIAGSQALLPGGGAVGAVREGAEAAAKGAADLLPATGSRVLNYAKGIGQEALGSGIEGAAYGLGSSVAEGDLGDPQLNAEHIMANAGTGALLGGIIGGGVGVLKGFLPEGEKSAQELLSKQPTTPEMAAQAKDVSDTLHTGLNDPNLPPSWQQPLQAAQDSLQPQDFAANQHDVLSGVRDQIDALPTTDIPEYAAARQQLSDHITQHLGNGDVWGDDVAALQVPTGNTGRKLLTKLAASNFGVNEDAIAARIANPEGFAAAPTPFEFAEKLKQAFTDVKQQMSDDSTASLNMVQQANKSVPLTDIAEPMRRAADALKDTDTVANERLANDLYDRVAKLAARTDPNGNVDLARAWTIKKDLQDDISGLIHDSQRNAAGHLIEMRKQINQVIKDNVPGYDAHMQALAADAKAYDGIAKKVTTDNGLAAFAKRVGRGTDETFEKQALKKFDANFGTDFSNEARMVWAKDQFTKASTNGSRKTNMFGAAGAAAGSVFGVPALGAFGGAQVGAFLDQQGGKVLSRLMSNAEKLQQIEKTVNQSINNVSKAVKSVFQSGSRGAIATSPAQGAEEHIESAEQLRLLANNIESMSDHVGNFTAPVYGAAPHTASALAGVSTAALGFLATKLPPPPQNSLFSPTAKPTPAQLQKFGLYVAAVKDPASVLNTVASGAPNKEGMETLQAVYPKLYQDMQTKMLHEITNLKNPALLPYSTRMGVSKFLGTPLDKSISQPALAANFMSYAQDQQQQAQHQQTGVKANAKLTQGTRAATTWQANLRGGK